MNILIRCGLVAFASLALAAGGLAAEFDPIQFEETRRGIERDLSKGKKYAEIGDRERAKVLRSLDRMSRMMDGKTSLDDLAPEQKVDLFNNQELVNQLLTQASEDSRMICQRERPPGSRIPVSVCKTVAQRRFETELARYNVEHNRTRDMTLGGGSARSGGLAGMGDP